MGRLTTGDVACWVVKTSRPPTELLPGWRPGTEGRLTLLTDPVDRAELLADPVARGAEVLRMPAGSNPSWLSRPQFDAVLDRLSGDGAVGLGAWRA